MSYSADDYDRIFNENRKIEQELESLDNNSWDKKKDRIKKYVENARLLLKGGKLEIGSKNEFASYIYHKLKEHTTVSRNGEDFYSLFEEDEIKNSMSRIVDEKSTNISSAKTVDEIYATKKEEKIKKDTRYTQYLKHEREALELALEINNAFEDKYNSDNNIQKIMDENFKEEMFVDLIDAVSLLDVIRDNIDDRVKLSDSQKCNLQLLINVGETKAEAARKVGICSKYASIGIERDPDIEKYWGFLNRCITCGGNEKEHRDRIIKKYTRGEDIGIEIPIKGY